MSELPLKQQATSTKVDFGALMSPRTLCLTRLSMAHPMSHTWIQDHPLVAFDVDVEGGDGMQTERVVNASVADLGMNFHLLKNMIYLSLFVLKGIYHYWKYAFFIYFSRGLKQMEVKVAFSRSHFLRAQVE